MTWCLYYLTKHPEVEEKILAELDKVLGDEDIEPQVALELKWVHFTPPNFKSRCFCWWAILKWKWYGCLVRELDLKPRDCRFQSWPPCHLVGLCLVVLNSTFPRLVSGKLICNLPRQPPTSFLHLLVPSFPFFKPQSLLCSQARIFSAGSFPKQQMIIKPIPIEAVF